MVNINGQATREPKAQTSAGAVLVLILEKHNHPVCQAYKWFSMEY